MAKASASPLKDRFRASSIHFGISLAIAALAALLVFGLWYPYPYRDASGGRALFLIMVSVDVVLGPLVTLAVFDRRKPRNVLARDLGIVGTIQLAALAYGLWTMSVVRPVHLVFEYDRFRVVHAVEIPPEQLDQAPGGIRVMPLTGPTTLALRPFRDAKERSAATLMDLAGQPLAAQPGLWQAYAPARSQVLAQAKPTSALRQRFPQQVAQIDEAVARSGRPLDKLVYLPMIAAKSYWTVLLDADSAEVCGYIPLDSF